MTKVRRCFDIDKETAEIIMEEMENMSEEEIRSRGGKG